MNWGVFRPALSIKDSETPQFQRRLIRPGPMSFQSVRQMITRQCDEIGATHPAFAGVTFTPHDFRRLFATDLVNNGVPIHIGAKLLGHLDLATTQGYVAVFEEETVRHYQDFLARRRAPYAPATSTARSATRIGQSSRSTSTSARSSSAAAPAPTAPPVSTNMPASAAPCCRSTPRCCAGSSNSRPTSRHDGNEPRPRAGSASRKGIDLTLRLLRQKKSAATRLVESRHARVLGMPRLIPK